MDIFYYWKDFENDLKDGRIGWLKSKRDKLNSFKSRSPDFIWAFKTPTGKKGQLQLLARLAWSDKPTVKLPYIEAQSTIFYIPHIPLSVRYIDTHETEAIEKVTDIIHEGLPESAFRANFHGENGQHGIEHNIVKKLTMFADKYKFSNLTD
jgi:hypothetical protein